MDLWFAGLLGVVQGLTEYIPVSSTAHLRIVYALFHKSDESGASYTAVIQLGSVVAVLAYFAKDLIALAQAMFKDPSSPEGRLPFMLAAGTVPIVIVGLLLKKQIETDLRSIYVIAGTLIGIGLVMATIDQFAVRPDGEARRLDSLTYRDAILVGLAQTLAVVPGVSRSGSTICMALLLGFTRSDSARFSFLLSIPAVAGAGILEARTAYGQLGSDAIPAIAVGVGVAAVTSYAAINWLIKWLGTHQLLGFAVYRVAIGIALIVGLLTKVIEAT